MGMGWMFREFCGWEVGGTSGMVTDDSETTYRIFVTNYIQIGPKKSRKT